MVDKVTLDDDMETEVVLDEVINGVISKVMKEFDEHNEDIKCGSKKNVHSHSYDV